MAHEWVKEFPGRVEVCDLDGVLLELNDLGVAFEGGKISIGDNILACHPEPHGELPFAFDSNRPLWLRIKTGGANILFTGAKLNYRRKRVVV